MNEYGERGGKAQCTPGLGTRWRGTVSFISRETAGIYWTEGWMGPITFLGTQLMTRKVPNAIVGNRTPAVRSVTSGSYVTITILLRF